MKLKTLPIVAMYEKLKLGSKALGLSVAVWAALAVPVSAQHFRQIPGVLTQIAVGGGSLLQNDVWGVNASNEIYRFNPSTQRFVQVSGLLKQIAVGGG